MMEIPTVILAGLIGTGLMTLFMYAMTYVTDRVMKVVKILGTMLTFQTTPDGHLSDRPVAIGVGIVGHYAVGVGFALAYYLLWSWGIGKPDYSYGVLFGLASGLLAILVWRSFFAIHPKPPRISLKPYLVTLFVAHFIFTLSVVAAYNLLGQFVFNTK